MTDTNNPSPASDLEAEVMNVFGLSDTPSALPDFGSPTEQQGEAPTEGQEPAPAAAPVEPVPASTTEPAQPVAAPVAAPAAVPAPALPPLAPQSPPAAAPAPVAPDPREMQIASLQAQVEALQRLVTTGTPQPGTPAPAAPEEIVKPEEIRYGLKIPDEVLGAVFNEDAGIASNGMHHLINNLASIIHRNVLVATRKDLGSFREELQRGTQVDEHERARAAAQAEYYADYPAHDNPHVKLVVAAEAQKLGAEYPGLPWGDQFKLALGTRVNQALYALGAAPAEPQPLNSTAPVQVRQTPPAKPAAFMPVAPSGGIPAFENDQDVIASTFSFGS